VGPIEADEARVALYRTHERGRGLDHGGRPPIDALEYESYFASSCAEGFELRFLVDGRLAAVAITDRGARALSAVYTYWDPTLAALSLGTYAILSQLALARRWDLDWLYLGLAIRENHSMAYKLAFLPHERRIAGGWRRFSRD
jgi:arginine-tRNA-protein transferase